MIIKKKNRLLKPMLLIVVLLGGCSDSTDNAPSTSSDQVNPLVGTWVGLCLAFSTNFENGYFIQRRTFTEDTATYGNTQYSDSGCNDVTVELREFSVNYSVGEDVMTTDGVTAKRLVTSSVHSPSIVTESVFRITGITVYFGRWSRSDSDDSPHLDYDFPYTRQQF
jgi:hypothetical protein